MDSERLELVRECAGKIDDGLAPLVAAKLVHPAIARIISANLRAALLDSSGVDASAAMNLYRTVQAVAIVDVPANQIGGA